MSINYILNVYVSLFYTYAPIAYEFTCLPLPTVLCAQHAITLTKCVSLSLLLIRNLRLSASAHRCYLRLSSIAT